MHRIIFLGLLTLALAAAGAHDCFRITVVDEATGRGVPLVELKMTTETRYWTDSNGIVAFCEPGLMGQKVYFHVRSHGYELPGEFPDFRGQALHVTSGGSAVIRLRRGNIAERLYRITGEGIYRDSLIVGEPAPIRQPVLNAEVAGQDTVIAVPYRGKLYWFWGDTNRLSLPLGHFGTAGAASELPGRGGLDPDRGVDFAYFVDQSGFSRPMLDVGGPGMKWMFWAVSLPDETGRERMVARFRSMAGLGKTIEGGLALYNDDWERFERYRALKRELDPQIPIHPFKALAAGREYLYLPGPYPLIRVPARLSEISDESLWETFTPFRPGNAANTSPRLDRAPDGRLRYGWKRGAAELTYDRQKKLVAEGRMTAAEGLWHLTDVETGAAIKPHAGSVYWNPFRGRWIMILQEDRGLADNGEIWFAEADTPVGHWVYARKIVTHDKYTFYNPTHHPFFDKEGGRIIYFEGTYSDFFSGSPEKTPRYNYNQIMYRLLLNDPRLALPAPVYRTRGPQARYVMREQLKSAKDWESAESVAFLAVPPARRHDGLLAVYPAGGLRFSGEAKGSEQPLFYALPPADNAAPSGAAGEWHCQVDDLSFQMILRVEGGQVTGTADKAKVSGTLTGGKLELRAIEEDQHYAVSATVAGSKLSGEVREIGEGDVSKLACERLLGRSSPALVPLYASGIGRHSGAPIGRVWRKPMSVLPLDYDVQPR